GRHQRASVDADLADRQGAPEVQPQRRGDAVERALVRAGLRAAAALLGGLVEEAQWRRRRPADEALRDGETDRHVPVVAARVHPAWLLRGVGRAARLLD